MGGNSTHMFDKNKMLLKPQNIAVHHAGGLGDLLVATAALYEITNMYPEAKITLVGSGWWTQIILPTQWPQIDQILETVVNKRFKKLKLWKSIIGDNSWNEVEFNKKSLKEFLKDFQMTIDFRSKSLRFAFSSYAANVAIRVGSNRSKLAKPLFTHFIHDKKGVHLHERDRFLNIVAALDLEYFAKRKSYWHEYGLPALKWFPPDYQKYLNSCRDKKLILINPTSSIREKAWQSHRFREAALKLKSNDVIIKIIGALNETEWLQEVAQEDFEIVQPASILELVDKVKEASLLITNTSSMQFIAAGTQTPTLTLVGSASEMRWGPLGLHDRKLKMAKECDYPKPKFISRKELGKLQEKIAYDKITVSAVVECAQKTLQAHLENTI